MRVVIWRFAAIGCVVGAWGILDPRPAIAMRIVAAVVFLTFAVALWRTPEEFELAKIRRMQLAALRHTVTCPLCNKIADDAAASIACDGVAHFNAAHRRKLQHAEGDGSNGARTL